MTTAGEGGPYGMALLTAYMANRTEGETLETYLNDRVFSAVSGSTMEPDTADVEGFNTYIRAFTQLLDVEKKAVEVLL
jgi:hypothetical protein